MTTALAEAIARLDVRFGARTVLAATAAAESARQRRCLTGTSFDRVSGGIPAGDAVSLAGAGTCGKVTLALRAVAGAQREGGLALWVDPSRAFDPRAAVHAGVDTRRVIVVRPRTLDDVILAARAGLRSEGFRLVVLDLGPSFAAIASADALAPVLPHVRGSTSGLLIVSDDPARTLAVPTFVFEHTGWETLHGRTFGWGFEIHRLGDARDGGALLRTDAFGRLVDDGTRSDLQEEAV